MEASEKTVVWVGLLTVAPREECTLMETNQGALVHVLTLAASESEYRAKVSAAMNHYCLDILQVEDIVQFSEFNASEKLAAIADELERFRDPKHVRFATLHQFPRVM
jgi:hypothetical protein